VVFIVAAGRLNDVADLEHNAFAQTGYYVLAVTLSAVLFIALRWSNHSRGQSDSRFVQFEDELEPVILPLSLSRDGVPVR
jgi:hypothetical protein